MIRRRAFLIASAISLVLCLGSAGLWVWGRTDRMHCWTLRGHDPSWGFCLYDSKLTGWVQSEASLVANPDATDDVSIGVAGFWYLRDSDHSNCRVWNVSVPFWFLVGASAVLPVLWTIRKKRKLWSHCQACGYDLRATPERCPECGRVSSGGSPFELPSCGTKSWGLMKPEIKAFHCPDVVDLARWSPPSQAEIFLPIELSIGPAGSTAADLFTIILATPQAIQGRPERRKPKLLVVQRYDWQEVQATLEHWVSECERSTWEEVLHCLRSRFHWEFEGYGPT